MNKIVTEYIKLFLPEDFAHFYCYNDTHKIHILTLFRTDFSNITQGKVLFKDGEICTSQSLDGILFRIQQISEQII